MPLPPRQPDLRAAIRQAMDDPAYRTTHKQIDDDLGVQSVGGGGEVHQAAANDMAGPVGFFCRQAADDEEIAVRCQAGDVVVAFRIAPPSDVSSAAAREPVLYDSSGNRIRCNGSAGPEITVGAGVCNIRSDGALTKKVALDGDKCSGTELMNVWMGQVETVCNGVAALSVVPLSSTFNEDAIANALATSSKLKAE